MPRITPYILHVRAFSFFTVDEYCELPLGFSVQGDITVEVWHYSTVMTST
jgi:hypothetical protein